MDATNVVTSTDTAGIGYHHQGQRAHLRTTTTTGDDHRAPNTPRIDVMTGEVGADPMLDHTIEAEVQVDQDTPAQTGTRVETDTQDGDTRQTATEPRADHPTDSGQSTKDHQLRTPGITLGVDHPHAATINRIDAA